MSKTFYILLFAILFHIDSSSAFAWNKRLRNPVVKKMSVEKIKKE
jgi:hypothetical protein